MFHRSERLFLRPAWPEDWEALLGGISDEGIVRHLATAPWPYTAHHARDFLSWPQDPRFPRFLLTLPAGDTSHLVGMCSLLPREDGELHIGYWIARPYWGQGFATEAARAVVEVGRMLGHKHISAAHHVDNPASGKVLRKAGFRPTGRVATTYCMARDANVESVFYERDLAAEEMQSMRAA